MVNFKAHIKDINKDYTSVLFAKYMLGEWGIEVGYKVLPLWWVRWRKQLADWQLANDCCALCLASAYAQQFTITAYGTGPCYTTSCSVYVPLNSGPHNPVCTHGLLGDFNDDFNNDFNN